MKPIIRVDNLWKRYRIGTTDAAYATFRESLTSAVTNSSSRMRARLRGTPVPARKDPEAFWRSKDLISRSGLERSLV